MTGSVAAFPFLSLPSAVAAPQPEAVEVADDRADPYHPLVEAAKTGDRVAVGVLLHKLQPLIVRYCRARVGRSLSTFASADDVAQEVCMAVLNALPSYRSSGASFLGFVYGIATHKIVDFHRKNARDRSTPVSDVPETSVHDRGPEQRVLQDELGHQLGELLGRLSEPQRKVLALRLIVGLSVVETAEAMDATPGAVRVSQHRALTKLRKLIAEREVAPDAVDALRLAASRTSIRD